MATTQQRLDAWWSFINASIDLKLLKPRRFKDEREAQAALRVARERLTDLLLDDEENSR